MGKVNKTKILAEIREFFRTLQDNPQHPKAQEAIKRAVFILQARQEPQEVATDEVRYNNGRGWCPRHVEFASSIYRWLKAERPLTIKQVRSTSKMLAHYSRQLMEHRLSIAEKNTLS